MAELSPRERLQPSLLDRLTDHAPDVPVESREHRILSARALREGVLRDLGWLMSVTNCPALPHLSSSVINYGMPDISGASLAGMQLADLERAIRQAIWDFEPRLNRSSVTVRAIPNESIAMMVFDR